MNLDNIELKIGYEIVDFFLVKDFSIKEAVNGKYLDINLINKNNEINGKLWKCNNIQNIFNIKRGDIIKIRGKIEEYRGNKQINISNIRIAKKDDNIVAKDLILFKHDNNNMLKKLFKIINSINNEDIKKLVSNIVFDVKDKLLFYPAAKTIHHNFNGGLLFHILTMINIALNLLSIYNFFK